MSGLMAASDFDPRQGSEIRPIRNFQSFSSVGLRQRGLSFAQGWTEVGFMRGKTEMKFAWRPNPSPLRLRVMTF